MITKAEMCVCNGCSATLIDENPQVGAVLHIVEGNEQRMEWSFEDCAFVCPNCKTDNYLVDK